ncbi:MAG: GTP-binding protein [Lentimonas sp.]|jgi:GTP-binding protein
MKITSTAFRGSAKTLEACPVSWLPEFAFVGRSNVGKSSLINMLTSTKELAKTSSMPGKTKLINSFEINGTWHLVDLPGYGFAKISRDQQYEFNLNVSQYLTERENLKHIFALVDSRLTPQESDLAFVEWLYQCKLPFSLVFTKTDKSSDSLINNHTEQFLAALRSMGIDGLKSFNCSSKTSRGRNPILEFIDSHLPKKVKSKAPKMSLGWMNKR